MASISYVSVSLIVVGVLIALMGLLALYSSPILVLGISLIPIGLLLLWSERSSDDLPVRIYEAWDNVNLVLEDIGVIRRAVYLPSTYTENDEVMALIPLTQTFELGPVKIPARFSVRYGRSSVGLMLYTPGSKVVRICREGGALGSGVDVNDALRNCLVNYLSLVSRVSAQEVQGSFRVEVVGPRLRNTYENTLVERVIGSPIASAVAGIVSEVVGRPMIIDREEVSNNKHIIYLVSVGGANVP